MVENGLIFPPNYPNRTTLDDVSRLMAAGLVKELVRLGIPEERMAAIGMGEARPIVAEEKLLLITDREERIKLDKRNRRVEVVITAP